MEARRWQLPLLILLLVFGAACLPDFGRVLSPKKTPAPAATGNQAILEAAETAYSQGQYQSALEQFKKYLAAEPNSPRLEAVLAGYGLAAEKASEYGEAISVYTRLIRQFPSGRFSREARPRLAALYLISGEAARAESLAAQLITEESEAERLSRLQLTLAQSQWLQNRYGEALGNFMTVWRSSSGPRRKDAEEGVKASLIHLDSSALIEIQSQYGANFPGAEATYLLLRQAAEQGDAVLIKTQADYFARAFAGHWLAPQVSALAQSSGAPLPELAFGLAYDPRLAAASALSGEAVKPELGSLSSLNMAGSVSVAVLLPLSGDSSSRYAQQVAQGLKLALNSGGAPRLGLKIMDTKGSAETAARLVEEAAADSSVLAVVGPFLSRESELAAQAANRRDLPLIAISQRTDLTKLGPYIFRIFLTPKLQAEAVARYAIQTQGSQTLGIIYPDDNYGRPMRGYFEAEVRRLGAQLTVAESYNPEAKDWEEAVKRITGGQVARKVSINYQTDTGFTALYLPDSAGPAAQIISLLAFHDVTRMNYLGTPLWLNRNLPSSSASQQLQGAVIPVAVSDLSARPETRRFIADYQSAYGQTPDQFAAYGYDAGLALLKALGQGASDRQSLRDFLSRSGAISGATGPFAFDADGDYLVEPTLLTIKDKGFVLLREPGLGLR